MLLSRIKSELLEIIRVRQIMQGSGWLLLLLLQLMTLNYDDAWSDDCLQPSKLTAILRNQQTDRLTEQNRMSSAYSLSRNKIRNNIIWLQNKWKHIFLKVFSQQWAVLWYTCNLPVSHFRRRFYHILFSMWRNHVMRGVVIIMSYVDKLYYIIILENWKLRNHL